ncbi:MAG: type III secretion inner membrane ring lipoprotein SctJ [Verrucomicrobia bacterium]|nr:type III secretion inner membrane ring lipoprotein SctJ [Verrucomicrobiota bacterium]MBU6445880.1 type III secretion inner membrane ring lipoprotein SctJ [Verrucomicrobiota bacterium]
MKKSLFACLLTLFLASCTSDQTIVNNIDERDANEIVVYLASKGISAMKIEAPQAATAAAATSVMFNIAVPADQATQSMALLNQSGLPRRQGTTLLNLFAGGGLVSSDREETIRYHAGLAEELRNTIRKMDGVLDADVQISYPPTELTPTPGAPPGKVTAAVYVKHQGIMDDPNSHMEVKIKRLMAGSINGLSYDDVSVISDRARIADISLQPNIEMIGPKAMNQTYAKIWGMVLSKGSLMRFRFVFFTFIIVILLLAAAVGWLLYKFYPLMRKKETPETPPPGP